MTTKDCPNPKCGTVNHTTNDFCISCGTRLTQPSSSAAIVTVSKPTPYNNPELATVKVLTQPKGKSFSKLPIVISSLVLLLIALGALGFLLYSTYDQLQATNQSQAQAIGAARISATAQANTLSEAQTTHTVQADAMQKANAQITAQARTITEAQSQATVQSQNLQATITSQGQQLNEAKTQNKVLDDKNKDLSGKLEAANKTIDDLNKKIDGSNVNNNSLSTQVESTRKELEQAKIEAQKKEGQINELISQLAAANANQPYKVIICNTIGSANSKEEVALRVRGSDKFFIDIDLNVVPNSSPVKRELTLIPGVRYEYFIDAYVTKKNSNSSPERYTSKQYLQLDTASSKQFQVAGSGNEDKTYILNNSGCS